MKTLKSYQRILDNNLYIITYVDNLGDEQSISADKNQISDIDTLVINYLNTVPNSQAMIKDINICEGVFSVSGDKLPTKQSPITKLSTDDKAIYDNFNNYIFEQTGSYISTLFSELNKKQVTINGVLYTGDDYVTLENNSAGKLKAATMVAIKIYNS